MKQPDIATGYEKVGQDLAAAVAVLVEYGDIRVRAAESIFERGYWLEILDEDGSSAGQALALSDESYEFLKKEIEKVEEV